MRVCVCVFAVRLITRCCSLSLARARSGVGKTTVSRLVAKLYHQLGVSSKDKVVEVQKGDLVAGYVNQTAMKTSKKIKEARGGILFVDEAYQLTQARRVAGGAA